MSCIEDAMNSSRIRSRIDDEDCHPRKRRRENDGIQHVPMNVSYKPRFVEFHFKMLKSLYDKPISLGKTPIACEDNCISSEEVNESVWDQIRNFLVERPHIIHSKKEATLWDNIRREAMKVSESESKARSPAKLTLGRIGLTPLSVSFRTKNSTPISPPKQSQSSENSFFIIAQFLGKESLIFREAYSHQKNAVRPLLSSTQSLIRRLEQDIAVVKQSIANEEQEKLHLLLNGARYERKMSRQHSNQECNESRLAELKAKMQLWQLLDADLQAIL